MSLNREGGLLSKETAFCQEDGLVPRSRWQDGRWARAEDHAGEMGSNQADALLPGNGLWVCAEKAGSCRGNGLSALRPLGFGFVA